MTNFEDEDGTFAELANGMTMEQEKELHQSIAQDWTVGILFILIVLSLCVIMVMFFGDLMGVWG